MKAAIVNEIGKTPVYGDFNTPSVSGENVLVEVTCAALSPVTKSRASGTHYSSTGDIPFIVGMDGVGTLSDGKRVYFVSPRAPFGSMAEFVPIRPSQCINLPDTLDDITAAAIAIPGMSSWAALKERAQLKSGETVLINGATGASGILAVQIAKHLGAKKVIATGRNIEVLNLLRELGADVIIPLSQDSDALEEKFGEEFKKGVDIVLDYLWGESAEALLIAAAKNGEEAVPIRFIQIGSISGSDIKLPSAVLRSSAIQLMGSGIGSIPFPKLFNSIEELLSAAPTAGFQIKTRIVPLSDIEADWQTSEKGPRIVFKIK